MSLRIDRGGVREVRAIRLSAIHERARERPIHQVTLTQQVLPGELVGADRALDEREPGDLQVEC